MASQTPCKTPFDIVDEVRQHFQQGPLSEPGIERQITSFRGLIDQGTRHLVDHKDGNQMPASLKGVLKIFGNVYLGEHLDKVEIVWDEKMKRFGQTEWRDDDGLRISINPEPFSMDTDEEEASGGSKTDSVLSTMAHEAIHALLMMRECPCKSEECLETWNRHNGENKGGHGAAFCRISVLVEQAVRRHMPWRIDLDVAYQAEKHLKAGGEPLDQETRDMIFPNDEEARQIR